MLRATCVPPLCALAGLIDSTKDQEVNLDCHQPMRIWVFLAINALLVVVAFAALSRAVLKYRSVWRATSHEADRLRGKLIDYAETGFYQAANARVAMPDSKTVRVVFLGDSITQRWNLSDSLLPYEAINRGVEWQTTSEMLVRLRPDVIDLKPAGVVILGGSNDFAPERGPVTLQTTQNNIRSMVELAGQHGIAVIIGTVPPICRERMPADGSTDLTIQLRERFNDWLRQYCRSQGCQLADFDMAMRERPVCDYLLDSVHPNDAGYAVMVRVTRNALGRALPSGIH